jgi:hypothetical protein
LAAKDSFSKTLLIQNTVLLDFRPNHIWPYELVRNKIQSQGSNLKPPFCQLNLVFLLPTFAFATAGPAILANKFIALWVCAIWSCPLSKILSPLNWLLQTQSIIALISQYHHRHFFEPSPRRFEYFSLVVLLLGFVVVGLYFVNLLNTVLHDPSVAFIFLQQDLA